MVMKGGKEEMEEKDEPQIQEETKGKEETQGVAEDKDKIVDEKEKDLPLIEKLMKTKEDSEETIRKMQTHIQKMEELMTEQAFGGRSFGNQGINKKETEDEKWAREAKLRYAGTGMDPTN